MDTENDATTNLNNTAKKRKYVEGETDEVSEKSSLHYSNTDTTPVSSTTTTAPKKKVTPSNQHESQQHGCDPTNEEMENKVRQDMDNVFPIRPFPMNSRIGRPTSPSSSSPLLLYQLETDQSMPTHPPKVQQQTHDSDFTQENITTLPTTYNRWDSVRSKLLHTDDLRVSLEAVQEISENFHVLYSQEYPNFLATLVPIFAFVLKSVPCASSPSTLEYQLRNAILILCTQLPQNEVLRPYAASFLHMSMDVLKKDYEENGLLASRFMYNLHRNYRPILVDQVQPFLDYVLLAYKNLLGNTVSAAGTTTAAPAVMTMCPSTTGMNEILPFSASDHFSSSRMQLWFPFMHAFNQQVQQEQNHPSHVVSSLPPHPFLDLNPAHHPKWNSSEQVPPNAKTKTATISSPAKDHRMSSTEQSVEKQSFQIDSIDSLTVSSFNISMQQAKDDIPTSPNRQNETEQNFNVSMHSPRSPSKNITDDPSFNMEMVSSPSIQPLNHAVEDTLTPNAAITSPIRFDKISAGNIVENVPIKTDRFSDNAMFSPSIIHSVQGDHDSSMSSSISPKAFLSFKVLAQCPQMLILLFQLYPRFIKNNMPLLLQVMMETLGQRPPVAPMISSGTGSNGITTGTSFVNPSTTSVHVVSSVQTSMNSSSTDEASPQMNERLRQRAYLAQSVFQNRVLDLLTAQIKTLSFSIYLLKGFSDKMKPYEDRLAAHSVHLLSVCPREALPLRRELFTGLRQIFTTEFWKGFIRYIDVLLDERILLGRHRMGECSDLRTMAYSALAGLLHHARAKLSMAQVSKVVHLYSKIINDTTVNSVSEIQLISVKVLLNMVDHTYNNKDAKASLGRDILYRILEVLVFKLERIAKNVDGKNSSKLDECKQTSEIKASLCELKYDPKCPVNQGLASSGDLSSCREIIRLILAGSKTLFWCINNYGIQREKLRKDMAATVKTPMTVPSEGNLDSNQRSGYDELSLQRFTLSELELIGHFFESGLKALLLFKGDIIGRDCAQTKNSSPIDLLTEYELFSASLLTLEGIHFHRVISVRLQFLVNAILDDDFLVEVPKYLLTKSSVSSRDLIECLVPFLLSRSPFLSDLSGAGFNCDNNTRIDDLVFKLFELMFSSLTKFPKNELAVRPFLQVLVAECLRRSIVDYYPSEFSRQRNYLWILRVMFRAVAGGKFEESYKELLPLLPTLLNGFYRVYITTPDEHLRLTVLELSLTVPARLSSLLPHLSLLLRVIVPSLNTGNADLVNLALRTLEFWIDNLNIEFLFPVLARDSMLLADLMKSLSSHLRPAPYQFGLLTLRLLGKLGGRNRYFFQGPMEIAHVFEDNTLRTQNVASVEINGYPVPVLNAVSTLKRIAASKRFSTKEYADHSVVKLSDIQAFLNNAEDEILDFDVCHAKLSAQAVHTLASSAFQILRSVLAFFLDVHHDALEVLASFPTHIESFNSNVSSQNLRADSGRDQVLLQILDGLVYATHFEYLRADAETLLHGIFIHRMLLLANNWDNFCRVDMFGNICKSNDLVEQKDLIENKIFGHFQIDSPLLRSINIFIMNDVIVHALSQNHEEAGNYALGLVNEITDMVHSLNEHFSTRDTIKIATSTTAIDAGVLYENLLYKLCSACMSISFHSRLWIFRGICKVMIIMGREWSAQFEGTLFHIAFVTLNSSTCEIARSKHAAVLFFIQLCWLLYGAPSEWLQTRGKVILDDFSLPDDLLICPALISAPENNHVFICVDFERREASSDICSKLVAELGSTNHTVRFAARHGLRQLFDGGDSSKSCFHALIERHSSFLKKTIFSRPLRSLPLPDQIASIETFFFVALRAPNIFPLDDNFCLIYLSDLLKMLGVADREMTSESFISVALVDKDGYGPLSEINDNMISPGSYLSHSSQIFLPNDVLLEDDQFTFRVLVPAEFPYGIQLRLASLGLFRVLVKNYSREFFSAPSSSGIGNIKPHVISLFFRSLTSRHELCSIAAHAALRDVLSKSHDISGDAQSNTSGISKDLVQTCIRPLLVNVRDYAKLSIHLLKGISRLLSLLSSWFSNTLGEKLLEHLQMLADPETLIKSSLWKGGDEPLVAAAIINLFSYLPDSSQFVEPLVKITIKLESVLMRYSSIFVSSSPLRSPLARYLNKYGSALVHFFLNDHRLKNPIYSDLLQDIISRKECHDLRSHLSSNDCTNTILNVCFERPLAIARCEKTVLNGNAAGTSCKVASEILQMHGINVLDYSLQYSSQDAFPQHDMEIVAEREHNDLILKGSPSLIEPQEKQVKTREFKRQDLLSNASLDKTKKEPRDSDRETQRNSDRAQFSASGSDHPRAMTIDALELQLQGFIMIESLILHNDDYMKQHQDVSRAFRLMWRSKGRHLRLLHYDSIPPRYNSESVFLARFMVNYAKNHSDDIDVLFDLLRIFLHHSSKNFNFVSDFITRSVSTILTDDQKKRVMQRFFGLLDSEGTEETKVLSIQFIVLPMLSSLGLLLSEDKHQVITQSYFDKNVVSILVAKTVTTFSDSKCCGHRLSIELLKLWSVLLDVMGNERTECHERLVKNSWAHLKSDDALSKSWAYVYICKFISKFETPAKVILQVYTGLLRCYEPDTNQLVYTALEILLAAIPYRLTGNCAIVISKITEKVLHEESNSLPSLVHILNVIIRHHSFFVDERVKITFLILSSLSKIALSVTSTDENKTLSIDLINLLLSWEETPVGNASSCDDIKSTYKRVNEKMLDTETPPNCIPNKESLLQDTFRFHKDARCQFSSQALLDKSDITTIANFLVRLILSLADSDNTPLALVSRATDRFRYIISKWRYAEIRFIYFEKIINMCSQDNAFMTSPVNAIDDNRERKIPADGKTTKSKGNGASKNGNLKNSGLSKSLPKESSPMQRLNEPKKISMFLLSSLLDLFISLLDASPPNTFLAKHAPKIKDILGPCFVYAMGAEGDTIRPRLESFLAGLAVARNRCEDYQTYLDYGQVLINSSLKTIVMHVKAAKGTLTETSNSYFNNATVMLLRMINNIALVTPGILELYGGYILDLSESIVTNQLENPTLSNKSAPVTQHPAASPTIAVIDDALKDAFDLKTKRRSKRSPLDTLDPSSIEIDRVPSLKCLILGIKIMGSSNALNRFTEMRSRFLSLLNEVLGKSENVRVLVSVIIQLGKLVILWGKQHPLTRQEKDCLMARIVSLYRKGFADVESQFLFEIISITALAMHDADKNNDSEHPTNVHLIQVLIGSTMSTNTNLRSLAVKKVISIIDKNVKITTPILIHASRLLQLDFEALGSRFITIALVNVLAEIYFIESNTKQDKFQNVSKDAAVDGLQMSNATVQKYANFCHMLQLELESFILPWGRLSDSVRNLVTASVALAQDFIEHFLSVGWTKASDDKDKELFIEAIVTFISHPYHTQYIHRLHDHRSISESIHVDDNQGLNSVRSIARAISKLKPMPFIDPVILLSLAMNYNCWHEARSMMEIQLRQQKQSDLRINQANQDLIMAMVRQLYLEIGEIDIWIHLKSSICQNKRTNRVLSLDLYGKVEAALELYNQLLDEVQTNIETFQTTNEGIIEAELSLWEDRWIDLNREMIQWSVLTEVSDRNGCRKLALECAWKNQDWEKLRSMCFSSMGVGAVENGDIEHKMSEIYLAVVDGSKLSEIENLHAQAAQLCLYRWQLLPLFFGSCHAHSHLLHQFHRLVELRESGQIMNDICSHSSARTLPESPKNIINVWRNRLPSDFDRMSWWDDIIKWRSQIFNTVIMSFSWVEHGTLATLHDRQWTTLRMARGARKHGIKDVALSSLAQLTDCAMDVSDAYSKLREQILSYKYGTELERTCGLNLIQTTNLSYFDSQQKSEMFRMKAEYLEDLGSRSKALKAYCHSVQLCPTSSRSWSGWGDLCWSLARYVEQQSQGKIESLVESERSGSSMKQGSQYLAQAMGCYLEAINSDASEWSRFNIPRCLWMMTRDDSGGGLICTTFEKYSKQLPPWVFLLWTPQLLSSLNRFECRVIKVILNKIIYLFPQAIYFPLRAFYLERRDLDRARSTADSHSHENVTHVEDLMATLRKAHPVLWTSLERILEELIMRFRPSPEEELLATMTALLQRAEYQIDYQKTGGHSAEADDNAIRTSFNKTLSRISIKFFQPQSDDNNVKKNRVFVERYKSRFEADFVMGDSSDQSFRLQLPEISSKLRKWKILLEKQLTLQSSILPLMTISPSLSSFCCSSPELWPFACDPPPAPYHDNPRKTDDGINVKTSQAFSSSSSITTAATAALNAARLVAIAARHEGTGGYYDGLSQAVEIPGHYSPNSAYDSKPSPELHPKITKFQPLIQLVFRNGQLARKIGLLGSDGKVYHFSLQFAVPYWTKTDERTAQIHCLLGKLLRKDKNSYRRHLWLKPSPSVPVAQRLKLMYEGKSYVTLEDIYALGMRERGCDPNAITEMFQVEVEQSEVKRQQTIEDTKSRSVKLHAYNEVCRLVDIDILSRFIDQTFSFDAERVFQFKKAFTSQLALNSLLQYSFDADGPNPSRFMFSVSTGQVFAPDFRLSYSNQGFLDGRSPVPFRLTRNIEQLIGPAFLQGIFVPSLCSAASVISSHEARLESAFNLIIRDDIVSWYMSKASQRDGTQKPVEEIERQLADRVVKNTTLILMRLKDCSARESRSRDNQFSTLDERVKQLVHIATAEHNLAEMPVSYCAWV